MFRKTTIWILAFAIFWSGIAPAFAQQTSEQQLADAKTARAKSFSTVMDTLRAQVSRADFDLDALIDKHEYDAVEIINFLRNQVRFEQYPGLLRGAQGTLISLAGNSLDQAVLLATLLKNNGEEARILHTTLSTAQVQRLLAELNISRRTLPENVTSSTSAPDKDAWGFASPEIIDKTTNSIILALREEGISLGGSSVVEDIQAEARDYFWVEYHTGPSQPWVPVHPAFAAMPAEFEQLQFTELFGSEIPGNLQHRFRLQAFIEQKSGSKLLVHEIMTPWERPTANLVGRRLSFSTAPAGLSPERLESGWDEVFAQSRFFIPLFNGEAAPGGKAFDLNGTPISLEDMSMDSFGAAALFQTVGGQSEKAAGAIAALGNDEQDASATNLLTLTALWLEYTLIEPGGEERVVRRSLLDRLGDTARNQNDFSTLGSSIDPGKLVTSSDFLVIGGDVADAFLNEQFLNSIEHSRYLEDYLLATPDMRQQITKKSNNSKPTGWTVPQLALIAISQQVPWSQKSTTYRSAPGVIALQMELNDSGNINGIVDIVTNSRRALYMDKNVLTSLALQTLKHGIWETFTEGVALVNRTGQPVPHVLLHAAKDNARYTTVKELTQLAAHGWPQDVVIRMRHDLERGYVLVVPVAAGASSDRELAWWRVKPQTGESLGIDSMGRGGVLAELAIVSIAAGLVAAVILVVIEDIYEDHLECKNTRSNSTKVQNCCMDEKMNTRKRKLARTIQYDAWVKSIDAMEGVRLKECGGR